MGAQLHVHHPASRLEQACLNSTEVWLHSTVRLNVLGSSTLPPPALHPTTGSAFPHLIYHHHLQRLNRIRAQLSSSPDTCARDGQGGGMVELKIKCVYMREGGGRGWEVITTTHGDRWKRAKEGEITC